MSRWVETLDRFLLPLDPSLPDAILLGGGANVLSVARNLRPQGIRVLVPRPGRSETTGALRASRCVEWVTLPQGGDILDRWLDWLIGPAARDHAGAALIPCGDNGLELILHHRARLSRDFRVYEANDGVLGAMLDKAGTYQLARQAGVPAPEVWVTTTRAELHEVAERVRYPCGLKPRVSHDFARFSDAKLVVARDAQELEAAFDRVAPYRVPMLVTELIPGGDAGYCSFYSYLDERGAPLFQFTKRKPRQFPPGFGTGTFHVTDWNPEVAALGLRFFQAIGLRGLACVEFKRDPRDGALKLIEVNHRFTEPNELLTRAGLDLATLVYNRLTGRPLPALEGYRRGMALAKPWEDLLAARRLVRAGELTWRSWLASRARPTSFLYFTWWDPVPFVARCVRFWGRQVGRLLPGASQVRARRARPGSATRPAPLGQPALNAHPRRSGQLELRP